MRGRLIRSERDKSGVVVVLVEEDGVLIKLLKQEVAVRGLFIQVGTGVQNEQHRLQSRCILPPFL